MPWRDESKQVLGKSATLAFNNFQHFRFHVQVDDLHTIQKRTTGVSQLFYNISSDTVAPLVGYSNVVLPKCINSVTALLLVNCMSSRQSTSSPKLVTDASLHWHSTAYRHTSGKYASCTSVNSASSCFIADSTSL